MRSFTTLLKYCRKYYGTITSDGNAAFYVSPYVAFKAIFCFRIISAIWFHISDPDETFNYWEPVSTPFLLLIQRVKNPVILEFLFSRVIIYSSVMVFKLGNIHQNMR